MEALQNLVQQNAVAVSAGILIVAYIFIAWEKISKVTIALLGACVTLFLGLLAADKDINDLAHYFTNYIDFNVIFLLVAMMIIVHITSNSGFLSGLQTKCLS